MNLPKVSIIIVNWNGKKWLEKCLESVSKQTYKKYEVIVVDNGSEDESREYVKKYFPATILIELDKNYGFAKANNIGIKSAKGDLVFLLNNDTTIDKDMLENIAPLFDNPRIGTIQPRIVRMDDKNKLDLAGAFWTQTTFLHYFGLDGKRSSKKFNVPMRVFSNKGAAMFVRKSMLDKIGGFDEDFWSYYEETDLCHRAWLSGFECWYYPISTCYHAKGKTSETIDNSFIQFHNFKNKLLSFIKNFEAKNLLFIIPTFIILLLGLSFFYLTKGMGDKSIALIRSLFWNITNLKQTLIKRKKVQKNRAVDDSGYLSITSKPISLKHILSLLSK